MEMRGWGKKYLHKELHLAVKWGFSRCTPEDDLSYPSRSRI